MRVFASMVIAGLASGPALADVTQFRTPSGNIYCSAGVEGNTFSDITCDLSERTGPSTLPEPAECDGDWGYQVYMGASGPVVVKCGSAVHHNFSGLAIDVARYGQNSGVGRIQCQSSEKGLTCRNEDGHGFFLSRRRQSVF